jgi:hypothetical protein
VNIAKLPQLFAQAPLRLTDPVKIVEFAARCGVVAIPRFSAPAPLNQSRGIKRRPTGESKESYILGRSRPRRRSGMLSETMRPPTGIFSAMLLGVVALLSELGIGVMFSEVLLPDITRMLTDLGESAREVAH